VVPEALDVFGEKECAAVHLDQPSADAVDLKPSGIPVTDRRISQPECVTSFSVHNAV
jgi:hypothetical protein